MESHGGETFRKVLGMVVCDRGDLVPAHGDESEFAPDIHPGDVIESHFQEVPHLVVLAGNSDFPRMVGKSPFPVLVDGV